VSHQLFSLAAILLVSLAGCGGETLDRNAVSGTVTLRGEPLSVGAIQLLPQGSGPASGGPIEDGEFTIAASDGPIPGSYRVEIISYQATGEQKPDPDNPGQQIDVTAQVIPPEYNTRSTQTVEITDGENELHFEIP